MEVGVPAASATFSLVVRALLELDVVVVVVIEVVDCGGLWHPGAFGVIFEEFVTGGANCEGCCWELVCEVGDIDEESSSALSDGLQGPGGLSRRGAAFPRPRHLMRQASCRSCRRACLRHLARLFWNQTWKSKDFLKCLYMICTSFKHYGIT